MASTYSGRHSKPLGVSAEGWAGAGRNMSIEALSGDTDLITVFDDLNGTVKGTDTFGGAAVFEDSGWVLTDDGVPVGDEIDMNNPANVDVWAPSCIRIFTGTADDAGGSMQLDLVNGAIGTLISTTDFPNLFVPETAAGAAVLDNTVWIFACRIGLRADLTTTGAGDWNSKAFIGWAAAGDTSIMDAPTGAITDAAGNLHGFHIPEDGSIDGISKRITAGSLVDGTNFTELLRAGGVDGTLLNGAVTAGDTMWFDLALRMTITDMSDNAANGATEFFHRRVPATTGPPGNRDDQLPGEGTAWVRNAVVLLNQTPNHSIALVPTIEVINGPTGGRDGVFFLDWWAFGCSRFSRLSR